MNRPKSTPVPRNFPQGVLSKPIVATVICPYTARDALEINLRYNQRLQITGRRGDWWYIARTANGDEAWVPSSYVKLEKPPSTVQLRESYGSWRAALEVALRQPKSGEQKQRLRRQTFPWLPSEICTCEKTGCSTRKADNALGACMHDVRGFMRSDEAYSAKWLWAEHLRWHPDRWGWRLQGDFKEQGLKAVEEMFVILDELSTAERENERLQELADQTDGVILNTQG